MNVRGRTRIPGHISHTAIVTHYQTSPLRERTHSEVPRTTMEAVPWKFVDSVVELLGPNTLDELAQEVRHPLWKPVVDLHHRNRVYYRVEFCEDEGGIKYVIDGENEDILRTIREKGKRFVRIVQVEDFTTLRHFNWDVVVPVGEAEATKFLETVAPLIDPVSASFCSNWGSNNCIRVLLTSLFKRAYLRA
uniref:Bro-N domain-containing protein n=1 Tax=Steinernema glaseri TaxID=37863 RepID=A0A1I7Y4T7_9BILA